MSATKLALPRVDALMPTYNRRTYLRAAIQSLLDEESVDLRVIVVDDASTDGSDELLAQMAAADARVVLATGDHRGVSAARNRALEALDAPFVTFLDSDDICAPGRIARQVGKLAADASLAAVIGERHMFDGDTHEPWLLPALERNIDICLASATFRRDVFHRLGHFDEELAFGEDLDLYLRLIEADWPILVEPEAAVFHRRHDGNMTNDREGLRRAVVRVYHKALKRRQGGAGGGRSLKTFFYQSYAADTVVRRGFSASSSILSAATPGVDAQAMKTI